MIDKKFKGSIILVNGEEVKDIEILDLFVICIKVL